MATLFGMFPFLKTLFADGGYQGPQFATALAKVLSLSRLVNGTFQYPTISNFSAASIL